MSEVIIVSENAADTFIVSPSSEPVILVQQIDAETILVKEGQDTFIVGSLDEAEVLITELGSPGPTGGKGDQGIQGPIGPRGTQGIQGPPGALGNVVAIAPIIYDSATGTLSIAANAYDVYGAAASALLQAKAYADSIKSARAYTFTQMSALATWVISHNLNTKPDVVIVDSANQEVFGDITYSDNNTLVVTFKSAFSGTAYLI